MARAASRKVRGEGHWIAVIDGRPVTNIKHLEPSDAAREAKRALVAHFRLEPGEERLVSDIARELEVPRTMIEEIPDDRDGYHLHVGDAVGGDASRRLRRDWTLYRELE